MAAKPKEFSTGAITLRRVPVKAIKNLQEQMANPKSPPKALIRLMATRAEGLKIKPLDGKK